MQLNPAAFVFWLLCGLVGFIFWGTATAVAAGVAIGIFASLIVMVIP